MQAQALKWLRAGRSVGLVPTMGALHEGHLSLVRQSKKENDITVIYIFANPKQFGPHEDFTRYPRSLKSDLGALTRLGVDFVFAPDADSIYPEDFQSHAEVERLSKPLEGHFRPGHFRGVTTVLIKFFNLVMPTRAYFGQKDFQQLQVVKQMIRDLNLPIQIVPCPIVREKDGLAMSSRNAYLTPGERESAPEIYKALSLGKAVLRKTKDPEAARKSIENHLKKHPGFSIDYVAAVDPETLNPKTSAKGKTLFAAAVRLGKTRLIDNILA